MWDKYLSRSRIRGTQNLIRICPSFRNTEAHTTAPVNMEALVGFVVDKLSLINFFLESIGFSLWLLLNQRYVTLVNETESLNVSLLYKGLEQIHNT